MRNNYWIIVLSPCHVMNSFSICLHFLREAFSVLPYSIFHAWCSGGGGWFGIIVQKNRAPKLKVWERIYFQTHFGLCRFKIICLKQLWSQHYLALAFKTVQHAADAFPFLLTLFLTDIALLMPFYYYIGFLVGFHKYFSLVSTHLTFKHIYWMWNVQEYSFYGSNPAS